MRKLSELLYLPVHFISQDFSQIITSVFSQITVHGLENNAEQVGMRAGKVIRRPVWYGDLCSILLNVTLTSIIPCNFVNVAKWQMITALLCSLFYVSLRELYGQCVPSQCQYRMQRCGSQGWPGLLFAAWCLHVFRVLFNLSSACLLLFCLAYYFAILTLGSFLLLCSFFLSDY